MKKLTDIETLDRDEMICPICKTEGLEENPAFADEYTGRASLLKATKCPNEQCNYSSGVPKEVIEKQIPESSLLQNLKPDISFSNIGMILLIVFGMIFMANMFGIISLFGDDTTPIQQTETIEEDINGVLIVDNITDKSIFEVQLRNSSNEIVNTIPINENGEYNYTNQTFQDDIYTLYLNNNENIVNPSGVELNTTDENIRTELQNIEHNFTKTKPHTLNQTVSNENISINYQNPNNVDSINFEINPIDSENTQQVERIPFESSREITVPTDPQNETVIVDSPITEQDESNLYEYTGEQNNYEVIGNRPAEDITIAIQNETATDISSETFNVEQSGKTGEFQVSSEETVGDVNITISNGTAQEQNVYTDTIESGDNITIETGIESETTGTFQVEPTTKESSEQITGQIAGSTIIQEFSGNQRIQDAKINFKGGDAEQAIINEFNIQDLNAQDGSIQEETESITIESDGEYRFEWDTDLLENSRLQEFSYKINGQENTIPIENQNQYDLELQQGDELKIKYESLLDTITGSGDDLENPHSGETDDDLRLVDYNIQNGQIQSFVIENTGFNDITEEFTLYKNGEQETATITETIPSQTEQVINFGTRNIQQPDEVNYIQVNEFEPIIYSESEITEYGDGSIDILLEDLSDQGEVYVDTNNDGELDCQVLAEGGECTFDSLDSGENTIDIQQDGVSNTDYEIEYVSRENPEDVQVDIDNNNEIDYDYIGVLNNVESESISVSPEQQELKIDSSNNIPVDISLTWESEAVIDSPRILLNNEEIISEDEPFTEDQTYSINSLQRDIYNLEFLADSGGYDVQVEWVEEEDQSYPTTFINNNQVCDSVDFASGLTCTTTQGTDNRQHTIDFGNTPEESFFYTIEYTAEYVPSIVNIESQHNSQSIDRPNPNPEPWNQETSTSILEQGQNNVDVNTDFENVRPQGQIELRYEIAEEPVENTRVKISNEMGYNVKNIESDILTENKDIEIPEEYLSYGENEIQFITDSGSINVKGEIIEDSEYIEITSN